jgi:hypothetical protein
MADTNDSMSDSTNSELPWEDNGEPSAERFYEMAWQNGQSGIRDVDHFKARFKRYITQSNLALLERLGLVVNGMYELSVTDIELRQHQQGVEIPVLPKTDLVELIEHLKQELQKEGE